MLIHGSNMFLKKNLREQKTINGKDHKFLCDVNSKSQYQGLLNLNIPRNRCQITVLQRCHLLVLF